MSNITSANVKCPFGICSKLVNKNHKAILCDNCRYWILYKCHGLTINDLLFCHLVMRYGVVKTVLLPYFPFAQLMILNCIVL